MILIYLSLFSISRNFFFFIINFINPDHLLIFRSSNGTALFSNTTWFMIETRAFQLYVYNFNHLQNSVPRTILNLGLPLSSKSGCWEFQDLTIHLLQFSLWSTLNDWSHTQVPPSPPQLSQPSDWISISLFRFPATATSDWNCLFRCAVKGCVYPHFSWRLNGGATNRAVNT